MTYTSLWGRFQLSEFTTSGSPPCARGHTEVGVWPVGLWQVDSLSMEGIRPVLGDRGSPRSPGMVGVHTRDISMKVHHDEERQEGSPEVGQPQSSTLPSSGVLVSTPLESWPTQIPRLQVNLPARTEPTVQPRGRMVDRCTRTWSSTTVFCCSGRSDGPSVWNAAWSEPETPMSVNPPRSAPGPTASVAIYPA